MPALLSLRHAGNGRIQPRIDSKPDQPDHYASDCDAGERRDSLRPRTHNWRFDDDGAIILLLPLLDTKLNIDGPSEANFRVVAFEGESPRETEIQHRAEDREQRKHRPGVSQPLSDSPHEFFAGIVGLELLQLQRSSPRKSSR